MEAKSFNLDAGIIFFSTLNYRHVKLESKIGQANANDELIYIFLSDFDKIRSFIPSDKVSNWEAGDGWCTFEVSPVGKTGIKIIESEAHKLLKYANVEESQYSFNFWVQLKQIAENDTRIKLTLDVNLNPMIQMMVKKPLKEFLDKLVDQLGQLRYES